MLTHIHTAILPAILAWKLRDSSEVKSWHLSPAVALLSYRAGVSNDWCIKLYEILIWHDSLFKFPSTHSCYNLIGAIWILDLRDWLIFNNTHCFGNVILGLLIKVAACKKVFQRYPNTKKYFINNKDFISHQSKNERRFLHQRRLRLGIYR